MRPSLAFALLITLATTNPLVADDDVSGFELQVGGGPVACTEGKEACSGHPAAGGFGAGAGYRFNRWVGLYLDADFGWFQTKKQGRWKWSEPRGPYRHITMVVIPRAYWRHSGFDAFAGIGFSWRRAWQNEKPWHGEYGEHDSGKGDWGGFGLAFDLGMAYDILDWLGVGLLGRYTLIFEGGAISGSCSTPSIMFFEKTLDSVQAFTFIRFRL